MFAKVRGSLVLGVMGVLVSFHMHAQSFEVTANFEPANISLGRDVEYIIEISKSDPDDPSALPVPEQAQLPPSPHFSMGRFETTQLKVSSAEGDQPVAVRMIYEITPNQVGRIIMPAFFYTYEGQQLTIPPALLNVRSPQFDIQDESVQWLSLRLTGIPENIWVGQRVKADLNLRILAGLESVTYGQPELIGHEFSLDTLSPGPTQKMVSEGQYRYREYTWPLTFTPLLSGDLDIGFKIAVNFTVPNDRVRFLQALRARDSRVLAELLLDSSEESLTVFSDTADMGVEMLQNYEGQGQYFGAIGDFEMDLLIEETEWAVGEPANVSLTITGTGNWGKLASPELTLNDQWRVFPAKDEFIDQDLLRYDGNHTFNYVVIPLTDDLEAFPTQHWVHFNTGQGEYTGYIAEPLEISVLESATPVAQTTSAPQSIPTVDPQTAIVRSNAVESDLRILWNTGHTLNLNTPLLLRPNIITLNILGIIIFSVLVFMRIRKNHAMNNPAYAREVEIRRWLSRFLSRAKRAMKDQDEDAFFESAFLSLCAATGLSHNHHVESSTVEDIRQIMDSLPLNESRKQIITMYLDKYELKKFSGLRGEVLALESEYARLAVISKRIYNLIRKETKRRAHA